RRQVVGVALPHDDLLQRQVEMIARELRIGGRMPLPVRLRTDENRGRPVRLDTDLRGLARDAAAGLNVGRDSEPAHATMLTRELEPLVESFPVSEREHTVEMPRELAAVVGATG